MSRVQVFCFFWILGTWGVQLTILTFCTLSCKTETRKLLVLGFRLVPRELLSCEELLLAQLSWASALRERMRRLSFSFSDKASAPSILTRPDRINLTSSHSWSLSGLDGGHRVAVKSGAPWGTVTPCSSESVRMCSSKVLKGVAVADACSRERTLSSHCRLSLCYVWLPCVFVCVLTLVGVL